MDVFIAENGREALVQLEPWQPVAHLEWRVDMPPQGAYWFCSICQTKPTMSHVGKKDLGCQHAQRLGHRLPLAVALRLAATIPIPSNSKRMAPGEEPPAKAKKPTKDWASSRGKKLGDWEKDWAETHTPPEVSVRREDPEAIRQRLAVERSRKHRPSTSPFANIARSQQDPAA